MPLFIPPALYYGGIAALGAGGRFLNANPQIVRGGINLFNKGVNKIANTTLGSIPQYVQSLATGTRFAPTNTSFMGNVVTPAMTAPLLADPKAAAEFGMYGVPYLQESVSKLTGGNQTGIVTDASEAAQNIIKEGGEIYDIFTDNEKTAADVEEELEKELEEKEKKEKEERTIYR